MFQKQFAWCIPYVAITIGLLVLRSAWLAISAYHAGILAVILLSRSRTPTRDLFRSSNWKVLAVTSAIGASSGILLYALWPFLSVPESAAAYVRDIGLTGTNWPLFIAYYTLATPLLEEYFWRGLLAGNSKWITPGDVFFAGYHLLVLAGKMATVWLGLVFMVIALSAWFWRRANSYGGGLLPSVASHAAADISTIMVIYLMTGS